MLSAARNSGSNRNKSRRRTDVQLTLLGPARPGVTFPGERPLQLRLQKHVECVVELVLHQRRLDGGKEKRGVIKRLVEKFCEQTDSLQLRPKILRSDWWRGPKLARQLAQFPK